MIRKRIYEAVHSLTRNEHRHSRKECLYYFTTIIIFGRSQTLRLSTQKELIDYRSSHLILIKKSVCL